jgi:hypothetical protein
MGYKRWDANDFASYARSSGYDTKSYDDVTNRSTINDEFLPVNFKNGIRESRDSAINPKSSPIIVAGDVTGSMGTLAGVIIKEGLNKLATELYDRKPVTDPHLLFMAIGDVNSDRVPVQATQFEADISIVQQLEKLYVEGGGGSNESESYSIAWIVAALMTRTDAWEKRAEKGVLFTYGDESVSEPIRKDQIKRFLGLDVQSDISAQEALTLALRTYDVYHLIIEETGHARNYMGSIKPAWTNLLGQRAIPVADHTKLPEIITSILQIRGGTAKADVVKSWSGSTALTVARAVDSLVPTSATPKNGVVTL